MKINRVLLNFILLICVGCIQQSPVSQSDSKQKYNSTYRNQSKACTKVKLSRDVFERDNLLGIFDCLGWSQEYPRLTNLLSSLSAEEFDSFARNYNEKFFKSRDGQDKYRDLLTKINDRKFIKHINSLTKTLLKTEYVNLFYNFVQASEDSSWLINDIFLDFFPFYLRTKAKLGNLSYLTKFKAIFEREEVQQSLNRMATELVLGLNQETERSKVLNLVASEQWPSNYFSVIEGKNIEELNKIFASDYDQMKKDLLVMINFTKNQKKNYCEIGGQKIYVNHKLELYETSLKIVNESPEDILYDVSELIEKCALYKNICSSTKTNVEYIGASERILKNSIDLLMVEGFYEFISKVMKVNLNSDPDSVLDFFKSFVSPFFISYHRFVKNIYGSDEGKIYEEVIGTLKKLDQDDFDKSRSLLESIGVGTQSKPKSFAFLIENADKFFVDLYSDLMINDYEFGSKIDPYLELVDFMPENASDRQFLTHFFQRVVEENRDEQFRNELVKFLSYKSLYQFTSLISGSPPKENVSVLQKPISTNQFVYNLFSPKCTKLLRGIEDINFDSIVDSGVFECSKNTSDYFYYNIFKWTVDIDNVFQENYGHKFSVNYGVVSPEMMGFYLNLILVVNENLYSPDRNYILETVNDVKETLESEGFISTLSSSLNVYKKIDSRIAITESAVSNAVGMAQKELLTNEKIQNVIGILFDEPRVEENISPLCEQLNPEISNLQCLSKEQFVSNAKEISNLLISKNESGKSALSYLFDMMYNETFTIPVDSYWAKSFSVDLATLSNFFSHVNDKSTAKDIYINNAKGYSVQSLTLSQRLEVLIRDISFNDNFYGIYFMNVASKADQYLRQMRKLKNQLRIMVRTSGMFRSFRVFNRESRWRFRNVWNTYNALLDLEGPFPLHGESEQSYVKLIQAVMASTVKASNSMSRNFHPYRQPNPFFVKDHKGHLITRLSDLSFITRVGLFLERLNSNVSKDRSDRLIGFWNKIQEKISREDAESFLFKVINSPNYESILSDLYDVQEKLNANEIVNLANASLLFIEDIAMSADNLKSVLSIAEYAVENYPVVRENILKLTKHAAMPSVEKLNDLSKEFWLRKLIIDISDDLIINEKVVKELVVDREFFNELETLFLSIKQANININKPVLKKILIDNRINWMTLIDSAEKIQKSELGVRYLDNVLSVMSSPDKNGNMCIEVAIKEIFKDPIAVESFLRNVFNKLEFIP